MNFPRLLVLVVRLAELEAGTQNPTASVAVYNYARLPDPELTRAERETSRIFSKAGIKIFWDARTVSPSDIRDEDRRESTCASLAFSVRILSRTMSARLARPQEEVGFALVSDAYVLLDRLEEVAGNSRTNTDLSRLLGNVLAHEIGHLLIGQGAHRMTGRMRPHWQTREYGEAQQGVLLFPADQAREIRDHLRAGNRFRRGDCPSPGDQTP